LANANKISVEHNVKIIEIFADNEVTSKMYVPKSTNVQTVPVLHLPQPSMQEKPEECDTRLTIQAIGASSLLALSNLIGSFLSY